TGGSGQVDEGRSEVLELDLGDAHRLRGEPWREWTAVEIDRSGALARVADLDQVGVEDRRRAGARDSLVAVVDLDRVARAEDPGEVIGRADREQELRSRGAAGDCPVRGAGRRERGDRRDENHAYCKPPFHLLPPNPPDQVRQNMPSGQHMLEVHVSVTLPEWKRPDSC